MSRSKKLIVLKSIELNRRGSTLENEGSLYCTTTSVIDEAGPFDFDTDVHLNSLKSVRRWKKQIRSITGAFFYERSDDVANRKIL